MQTDRKDDMLSQEGQACNYTPTPVITGLTPWAS